MSRVKQAEYVHVTALPNPGPVTASASSDGVMEPLQSLCSACERSISTRLIVFNRVPKCGSTSLEAIFRQQAGEQHFTFVRATDFVNNSLDTTEQATFAHMLNEASIHGTRTLYDRHVLYVDFAVFGLPPPVYINLLREPLRMQVSAFYYWRQCVCVTHQQFCVAARTVPSASDNNIATTAAPILADAASLCSTGYSMDTLYANVSARPTIGLMTRWFCGHGRACGGGRSAPSARVRAEALRLALHHLSGRYLWVGILERLEDSLRLCGIN